jgi:hypothetical protein
MVGKRFEIASSLGPKIKSKPSGLQRQTWFRPAQALSREEGRCRGCVEFARCVRTFIPKKRAKKFKKRVALGWASE